MELSGRAVIVTGGASGLGGAAVDMIVASGGRAVVLDLDDARGRSVEVRHPGRVQFIRTDVTSEREVDEAVTRAVEAGPIHGLVNAAGVPLAARVLGRDGPHRLADFTRVVQVNLAGTFNVIRLAAAVMAANDPLSNGERGDNLKTASVDAYDGLIGKAAYAAS